MKDETNPLSVLLDASNSLFWNILPISPLNSKILREFFPNPFKLKDFTKKKFRPHDSKMEGIGGVPVPTSNGQAAHRTLCASKAAWAPRTRDRHRPSGRRFCCYNFRYAILPQTRPVASL
jgi:hypothetical protein